MWWAALLRTRRMEDLVVAESCIKSSSWQCHGAFLWMVDSSSTWVLFLITHKLPLKCHFPLPLLLNYSGQKQRCIFAWSKIMCSRTLQGLEPHTQSTTSPIILDHGHHISLLSLVHHGCIIIINYIVLHSPLLHPSFYSNWLVIWLPLYQYTCPLMQCMLCHVGKQNLLSLPIVQIQQSFLTTRPSKVFFVDFVSPTRDTAVWRSDSNMCCSLWII